MALFVNLLHKAIKSFRNDKYVSKYKLIFLIFNKKNNCLFKPKNVGFTWKYQCDNNKITHTHIHILVYTTRKEGNKSILCEGPYNIYEVL